MVILLALVAAHLPQGAAQNVKAAPAMLELDYSILPEAPVGAQCMLSGVLGDSWVLAMGNRANALWDEAGLPRPSWARPAGGCWTGGYSLPLAQAEPAAWSGAVPFSPSCVKDTHCADECLFANRSHWPTCTAVILTGAAPAACCTGTCGNYVGTGLASHGPWSHSDAA
jgi:hypothetical protein